MTSDVSRLNVRHEKKENARNQQQASESASKKSAIAFAASGTKCEAVKAAMNIPPEQSQLNLLVDITKRKMHDDFAQVRAMIVRAQNGSEDPTVDDVLKIVDRLSEVINRMKFLMFPNGSRGPHKTGP